MIRHIVFILAALFLILGIPALFFSDWDPILGTGGVDAVSGASLEVPDSPSGNFYVFMNTARHSELEAWRDFFEERPVGVIFEDISCQVLMGDVTGIGLAERYQARLAENQMKLRAENPVLLSSKIENGIFDVAVVSEEIAEAMHLEKVFGIDTVMTIPVSSDADPNEAEIGDR